MTRRSTLRSKIEEFLDRNQQLLEQHRAEFPKAKLKPTSNEKAFLTWQRRAVTVRKNLKQTTAKRAQRSLAAIRFETKERKALCLVNEMRFIQTAGAPIDSIALFDQHVRPLLLAHLQRLLRQGPQKAFLLCIGEVEKDEILTDAQDESQDRVNTITKEAHFAGGPNTTLLDATHITPFLNSSVAGLQRSLEKYTNEGSGWRLGRVLQFVLCTTVWKPLAGRGSFVPTPQAYASKKAVINVENNKNKKDANDHRCFLWSVLAHLYPQKENPSRLSHYRDLADKLDLSPLTFPVPCNNQRMLKRFEELNNLSINIYEGITRGDQPDPRPLYISDRMTATSPERQINLLFIQPPEPLTQESASLTSMLKEASLRHGHYLLIKNFSRMMGGYNLNRKKKWFCRRCLCHKYSEEELKKHIADNLCGQLDAQKAVFPPQGKNVLSFKKYKHLQRCPFIIYADFESLVQPVQDPQRVQLSAKHVNCSYAMALIGPPELDLNQLWLHRRAPEHDSHEVPWDERFFHDLECMENIVREQLQKVEFMTPRLTDEEEEKFNNAGHCHICDQEILPNEKKVRDHCHLTGKYRGAAHNSCNLNYNLQGYEIPVVFHNLKGYDGHFILKNLTTRWKERKYNIIAQNTEKFLSLTVSKLKFIDSFAFLNSSLDTLSKNLGSSPDSFPYVRAAFPNASAAQFALLLRKGVYPYEYMDSLARFQETELPPIAAFASKLSDTTCSQEDYAHALKVWKAFDLQTLGQYHDLYLKLDVLLLAQVFESFRDLCLDASDSLSARLDPAWYVSLPSYSWACMLKSTKVKLHLFTAQEQEMYQMVEAGIRGGQCMITTRHAKANNPYMKSYDPTLPTSSLIYWDANNLYGHGMSQRLPIGDFRWAKPHELSNFTAQTIATLPDDASDGYILEVDLDYPAELHDLHNDLPFCLRNQLPNEAELTAYQRHILEQTGRKYQPTSKLLGTLHPKSRYILHYRNLKQCLANGLLLTKVHRVLAFTQTAWLQPYIEYNTAKRAKATNDFAKDFYKLMNNAVYGKTMENVRKRMDYAITMDPLSAMKRLARPTFKRATIIRPDDDNGEGGIIGIELCKNEVTLDKPIYAGFAILEHSKHLMYDFHYNYVKRLYGTSAKLLMTDTDSLMYQVYTADIYQDMKEHAQLFDTSDYPKEHPCYSVANKKVIGKMKDEANSFLISEFVGLRAKMYSFVLDDPSKDKFKKHQKAKGIKRNVVSRCLTHEKFKSCLTAHSSERVTINSLRSYNHDVYGITQEKAGLSSFDDKRAILPNGYDTLAYGHWRLSSA